MALRGKVRIKVIGVKYKKFKLKKQHLNMAFWLFAVSLFIIGSVVAETDDLMPVMMKLWNVSTGNLITSHSPNVTIIFNNTAGSQLYNESFIQWNDGFLGEIVGNQSRFSTIYGEYYLLSLLVDNQSLAFNNSGTTQYHQTFQSNYGNITSKAIQNDNITSGDIQGNTLTDSDIGTIDFENINWSNTLGGDNITDSTITTNEILDGTIDAVDIGSLASEINTSGINNSGDLNTTSLQVNNNSVMVENLTVDTPTFHVDSNTNTVGIASLLPLTTLFVNGDARIIDNMNISGSIQSPLTVDSNMTVSTGLNVSEGLTVTGIVTLPTDSIDSGEITDATIDAVDVGFSSEINTSGINNSGDFNSTGLAIFLDVRMLGDLNITGTTTFSTEIADASIADTLTIDNAGTVDPDAVSCDVGDDDLISKDCIGDVLDADEITDIYVLIAGDTMSGELTVDDNMTVTEGLNVSEGITVAGISTFTTAIADASIADTLTIDNAGSVDPDSLACDSTDDDTIVDACMTTDYVEVAGDVMTGVLTVDSNMTVSTGLNISGGLTVNTGSVAIGSVNPNTTLDVIGDVRISDDLNVSGDAAISNMYSKSDVDTNISDANTSMKGYVDTQDSAQDECSEITNCVANAWDADGDISADEISESKIAFSTVCAAGNHYYLNGNDLACEADDDTSANTECSGGTTYMDGDGNCDDISSVYVEIAGDTITGALTIDDNATVTEGLNVSEGLTVVGTVTLPTDSIDSGEITDATIDAVDVGFSSEINTSGINNSGDFNSTGLAIFLDVNMLGDLNITGTTTFSTEIADGSIADTLTIDNAGTVDPDAVSCDVGDDNLISKDCIGDVLDADEITDIYLFNNAADSTSGAFTVDSNMTVSTGLNVSEGLTVNTGNVGIGTASPISKVNISAGSAWNSIEPALLVENMDTQANEGNVLRLQGGSAASQNYLINAVDYFGDSLFIVLGHGNAGVNDSTPDYRFEIDGDSGSGYFAISDDGSDANILEVDGSGNVGIATAIPAAPLHVNTTGQSIGVVIEGEQSGIIHRNSTGGNKFITGLRDDLGDTNEDDLVLYSYGGNTVFTGSANHKVGIGTASPNYLLGIADTTGSGLSLNVSDMLYVNGTEQAVGINTSHPESALHIVGKDIGQAPWSGADVTIEDRYATLQFLSDGDAYSLLRFGDNGTSYEGAIFYSHANSRMEFSAGGTQRMYILSDGNVGIGDATPGSTLAVTGNLSISGNLAKGSGTFTIDNPENPYDEILQHSFFESPEMRNAYIGIGSTTEAINYSTDYGWNYSSIVISDKEVKVTLPEWFKKLNFRNNNYNEFTGQITGRNGFCGDNFINFSEIEDNYFKVKTELDCEFSWIIHAVRHDEFAENNRIQVVLAKAEQDLTPITYTEERQDGTYSITEPAKEKIRRKGRCLHSEACDKYDIDNPGHNKKILNPLTEEIEELIT